MRMFHLRVKNDFVAVRIIDQQKSFFPPSLQALYTKVGLSAGSVFNFESKLTPGALAGTYQVNPVTRSRNGQPARGPGPLTVKTEFVYIKCSLDCRVLY